MQYITTEDRHNQIHQAAMVRLNATTLALEHALRALNELAGVLSDANERNHAETLSGMDRLAHGARELGLMALETARSATAPLAGDLLTSVAAVMQLPATSVLRALAEGGAR